MIYAPTNIRQFADTRETSIEVALAIFELAEAGDESRMWTAPTAIEAAMVTDRAFELSPPDVNTLCWGVETLTREDAD